MPRAKRQVDQQTSLFRLPTKAPLKRRRLAKVNTPTPIALAPGKKRWLSASSLETRRRCPRCFWLQVNLKIPHPEGIVSRLANRFDGVIKRYFDLYRGTPDLPPLITGQIEGRLESPFQEKYFVDIDNKYGFLGKLDECVVLSNGTYSPVDHKTASSDPKTRELIPAYQFQLDSYTFLLQSKGKKPSGVGHLIYFYPADGQELHRGFPMEVTVKTLETNPDRVKPAIQEAIEILEGAFPESAPDCPFCQYVETVNKLS